MQSLTPRQTQIVFLLANGRSTKQIAFQLGITPRTCKRTLAAAKERLQAETREHLVALSVAMGIVLPTLPAETGASAPPTML